MVVKINDNEILCIYIVDNKFDVISISDGKAYDLHGCPLARTREILNGLFDMFEQIRVLPPLRVFFGKEGRPETFIGDGDENTLFGRNWSNKLYYKCFTKSAKPCRTESCNEADIPVWLAAKETRRVAKQVSGSSRKQSKFVKSLLEDGRKSTFCAMHQRCDRAAHMFHIQKIVLIRRKWDIFMSQSSSFIDKHILTISPSDFQFIAQKK